MRYSIIIIIIIVPIIIIAMYYYTLDLPLVVRLLLLEEYKTISMKLTSSLDSLWSFFPMKKPLQSFLKVSFCLAFFGVCFFLKCMGFIEKERQRRQLTSAFCSCYVLCYNVFLFFTRVLFYNILFIFYIFSIFFC